MSWCSTASSVRLERGADQVEPAERARLELLEFLLVFDALISARHQPNRPLT